jgi:hypothetical protein
MTPTSRILPAWSALTLAAAVSVWLCATPVAAQGAQGAARPSEGAGPAREPGGGGGGAGGGGASGGSGGGGSSAAGSGGGGSQSSGGGGGGGGTSSFGGSSGSGRDSAPGRFGATGGSGYAAPRGDRSSGGARSGGGTRSGGSESGANSGGTGERAPITNTGSTDRAVRRGDGGGRTAERAGEGLEGGVPAYARPRDGKEPIGTAVPRGTVPMLPDNPRGGLYIPGGYYGGYYDPWWYGAGYTGAYGGYYDPWYGGYPSYPQGGYSSSYQDEGALRLKIKPRGAEVYVDGFFVGVVDDFDGIFQRLHLETGAHRIEVRAAGYESLAIDVRITPEHTTTYQGELKKIQ